MKDFEDLTVFTQDMDGYMTPAEPTDYPRWVRAEEAEAVLDKFCELQSMYERLCK